MRSIRILTRRTMLSKDSNTLPLFPPAKGVDVKGLGEVEMVGIKRNGVYCLASLFPFDVYASEVYPELSDWDATKKLEERIRGLK